MRDVQEWIDEIGRMGSSIFSTIDLTSRFWQMMLNPECQKYTVFTLLWLGQFKCNTSLMGMFGAPGLFQRLMEIFIHNLTNILAYINNLLVHTKDHNKHLEILEQLFVRLRKHWLKINLPKSFFGAVEVSYLGALTISRLWLMPSLLTMLIKSDSFSFFATSSEGMSGTLPKLDCQQASETDWAITQN